MLKYFLCCLAFISSLAFATHVQPQTWQTANIVLSPDECDQFAIATAMMIARLQGAEMKQVPELTKNVQRMLDYMVAENPEIAKADPGEAYQFIQQSCYASGGQTIIPEPL